MSGSIYLRVSADTEPTTQTTLVTLNSFGDYPLPTSITRLPKGGGDMTRSLVKRGHALWPTKMESCRLKSGPRWRSSSTKRPRYRGTPARIAGVPIPQSPLNCSDSRSTPVQFRRDTFRLCQWHATIAGSFASSALSRWEFLTRQRTGTSRWQILELRTSQRAEAASGENRGSAS